MSEQNSSFRPCSMTNGRINENNNDVHMHAYM